MLGIFLIISLIATFSCHGLVKSATPTFSFSSKLGQGDGREVGQGQGLAEDGTLGTGNIGKTNCVFSVLYVLILDDDL
jgi:hypothetical protein